MIYIVDNFLPQEVLNELILSNSEGYIQQIYGDKSFWIKESNNMINSFVTKQIEQIESNKIKNILSFFRQARQNEDNEWGIHNDSIIFGEKPDRAIVLFLESSETEMNGTAFWEHKTYGDTYRGNSNEEFDRILLEDANNRDLWNLKSVIGYKQNRLLSYPCNYFHSKYPNEFINPRRVFVMFYKVL